jgi:predicted ABC-type ATPase
MGRIQPQIIIIGGPNGSGKSTLANEVIRELNIPYLSADSIAQELNPTHPEEKRIESGKVFFNRLSRFTDSKQDIIIESTLSGRSLVRHLKDLRALGTYSIQTIYLFIDNPELCWKRVQIRAKKGGHIVPKQDVIRRYTRSMINFWYLYRDLSDEWYVYYNGEDAFHQILRYYNGITIEIDEVLVRQFKKFIQENG